MMPDTEKLLELIRSTKMLMDKAITANDITVKGDKDFVTATDLQVQAYLKSRLTSLMPEAGFFAEENREQYVTDGLRWILDPIDGTTNFMHGLMHHSVSLALADGSSVLFGCVYCPSTDELFYAQKGGGAFMRANGKQKSLQVSRIRSIADALVTVGTSPYYKELADSNFRIFRALFDQAQDIRRLGSAALDCCYVAEAAVDVYFERRLKPWDYAAGSLILTEAGGLITDLNGAPPSLSQPSDIVATNGYIHEQILKLIRDNG